MCWVVAHSPPRLSLAVKTTPIESTKTTMEDVSTGVLEKIKNI